MDAVLTFVALLGGSVWVGGFVAIVVVNRVAQRQLDPPDRVAFFRDLGHSYGVVSTAALALALISGAILLAGRKWDALALAAVILAAAVVVATMAGVMQARQMTRLRQAAIEEPGDAQRSARVERDSRQAALLRATIGVLSVALLAVAAALAT